MARNDVPKNISSIILVCPDYNLHRQRLFNALQAAGRPYSSTNDLLFLLGPPEIVRLVFVGGVFVPRRHAIESAPAEPVMLYFSNLH